MSSDDDHGLDDPRLDAGCTPVPGDLPAGSDVRDDPEFETVEGEVRRMEADGPTVVRWADVADTSLSLLRNKAKDLLVGAWLSFALYQTESYRGLAIGLVILRDMIENYWDGLYPPLKRERGRVAALEWLVGRLAPSVGDNAPGEQDAAFVVAAHEALAEIDRLMDEKLVKEQAALGELVRALRPHAEAARRSLEADAAASAQAEVADSPVAEPAAVPDGDGEAAAPPAEPASQPAAPPAPGPSAAAKPAAPLPDIASDVDSADADRAVGQLDTALRKLAAALRSANPADARAYLYVRAANWFALTQPPPHQGGKTMLPPPAAERLAGIETMRSAQQHQEALLAAESLQSSSPFWLDGQRIVAQTLGALGAPYEPARLAVVSMSAALTARLPELVELRFADDSPFADDATRRWIAEAAPTPGGGAANGAAATDDTQEQTLAEARALAAAGKARDGLDLLGASLRAVSAGRERFVWQLSQAAYCLENGFVAAAVSLVDHLDRTVDTLGLEQWEPALAARAAELRYRAFRHAEAEKIVGADRRQIALEAALGRLARIDVAAAAGLPH